MEKQTDIRKEYFDLGEKQGRTQAISEFKEKLKERLPKATLCTYSETVYHIWDIIEETAQEIK